MTRSPVAWGSKVPAWPLLFSPNWERALSTMSWLVRPAGLSTKSRPVMDRIADGGAPEPPGLFNRHFHRRSRSRVMPPAAETAAECVDVKPLLGARRKLDRILVLPQQGRDFHAQDGPGRFHDTVAVLGLGAALVHHRLADHHHGA